MVRQRHTRNTDSRLAGPTIQKSLRIPLTLHDEIMGDIDSGIPEVHTFVDAILDALWVWHYENRRNGGGGAGVNRLDVSPITAPPPVPAYGPVTFHQGETKQVPTKLILDYAPTEMDNRDPGVTLEPGDVVVLTPDGGHVERPNWGDVDPDLMDVNPVPD